MPYVSCDLVWSVVGPPRSTVDQAYADFVAMIPNDIDEVTSFTQDVLDDVMLLEDSLNKVDDIDNLYIKMYTWDNVDTSSGFCLLQRYMRYCIDGTLKIVIPKPHYDWNLSNSLLMDLVQRDVLSPANIELPANYDSLYVEDDMKDWFQTEMLDFCFQDYQ